ncbi:MAG: hypothetical protein JRE47_15030 [Deltaproteobacteria bacterium]|nr:hypothetical protein [Deltaproteobacteria bacterium]
MPTTEQLRGRLIDKLKELFQLDQPDLDFGFYRIMHARAEQITDFLTTDLLKIVENAFGKIDDGTKRKLKAKYDQEVQNAKEYGAPEPEKILKVKEAKAAKFMTIFIDFLSVITIMVIFSPFVITPAKHRTRRLPMQFPTTAKKSSSIGPMRISITSKQQNILQILPLI